MEPQSDPDGEVNGTTQLFALWLGMLEAARDKAYVLRRAKERIAVLLDKTEELRNVKNETMIKLEDLERDILEIERRQAKRRSGR